MACYIHFLICNLPDQQQQKLKPPSFVILRGFVLSCPNGGTGSPPCGLQSPFTPQLPLGVRFPRRAAGRRCRHTSGCWEILRISDLPSIHKLLSNGYFWKTVLGSTIKARCFLNIFISTKKYLRI